MAPNFENSNFISTNFGDIGHHFKLWFEEIEKHQQLGDGCRSGRFIPTNRSFVFLKRSPIGPHMDCDSIGLFDLENGNSKELVSVVKAEFKITRINLFYDKTIF